jgi:hypothetical protein
VDNIRAQEIDKGFMSINLKIATVVIFCLSACLSIPKIADAGNFSSLVETSFTGANNSTITTIDKGSERLQDIYVPPNYGGPDSSQHGSGTR